MDVRVISATHRDLPAEIALGKFREDLYYRLRVVTLELPPLRAHKDDLPLLAEAFLEQLGARHGRRAGLSAEAVALVRRYDWPGNVRELRNALERALVLSRGDEITAADLPDEVRHNTSLIGAPRLPAVAGDGEGNAFLGESDFREAKRQFEVAYRSRSSKSTNGMSRRPPPKSACIGRACRKSCASSEFSGRGKNETVANGCI